MALLELLEREPAADLHQVHEPEIARAEHHDLTVGDVVLGPLRLCLLGVGPAGRLLDGGLDHCVLLVAARVAGDLGILERPLDKLVEPVAVALLERGALRLTMVGEHDDLVRPRRVPPRAGDAAELLVELAQSLHRVGPLEPRVVGDLVVAGERRVHGRAPAHHVAEDAEDDKVADDYAHDPAHQRVDPAPMAAGADVAALRPSRRRQLQRDLPRE